MPDTFIPLTGATATAGGRSVTELKVLPQAEATNFQPMTTVGASSSATKACAGPSVTLQRRGDEVSAIRIECGCGQVIELACVYEGSVTGPQ
ncbi:MAG: hypothetical protein ABSG59_02950 [Verrucomicrobiota bacterium]|jgi:hypothetical protein